MTMARQACEYWEHSRPTPFARRVRPAPLAQVDLGVSRFPQRALQARREGGLGPQRGLPVHPARTASGVRAVGADPDPPGPCPTRRAPGDHDHAGAIRTKASTGAPRKPLSAARAGANIHSGSSSVASNAKARSRRSSGTIRCRYARRPLITPAGAAPASPLKTISTSAGARPAINPASAARSPRRPPAPR